MFYFILFTFFYENLGGRDDVRHILICIVTTIVYLTLSHSFSNISNAHSYSLFHVQLPINFLLYIFTYIFFYMLLSLFHWIVSLS